MIFSITKKTFSIVHWPRIMTACTYILNHISTFMGIYIYEKLHHRQYFNMVYRYFYTFFSILEKYLTQFSSPMQM